MGVNAAVVGAILGATVSPARGSFVDSPTIVLAGATFVPFLWRVDAVSLIFGGAVGIGAFLLL